MSTLSGLAGRGTTESRERPTRSLSLVLPANNQGKPITEDVAVVSQLCCYYSEYSVRSASRCFGWHVLNVAPHENLICVWKCIPLIYIYFFKLHEQFLACFYWQKRGIPLCSIVINRMQEFPIIIIFFIAFYVRSYVLEFSFSATTHQRKHLGDYDRFAIFLRCLYVKFSEAIMLNVQAADYELRDSPLIAFNGMSSFFFFAGTWCNYWDRISR